MPANTGFGCCAIGVLTESSYELASAPFITPQDTRHVKSSDSEIQKLHLEVSQLEARLAALEKPQQAPSDHGYLTAISLTTIEFMRAALGVDFTITDGIEDRISSAFKYVFSVISRYGSNPKKVRELAGT